MIKDLHKQPFDENTLKKLEIFELYTKEWLPTFIMSKVEKMCIFDFFAGTGYDLNHVPGSPIRILRQIKAQLGNLFQKGNKIHVILNEYDKVKYVQLKTACNEYVESDSELRRAKENHILTYEICNEDFALLFPKCMESINEYPSLVFLDQNGVKFLSAEYFMPLVNSRCTDFLYFVSSSYVKRFGSTNEFRKYIPFDKEKVEHVPFTQIHQYILEELKKRIPFGNKTHLYPFTIKKGSNYYGIIFGASHIRAVDKFLSTAWKENKLNGAANFDIDNDVCKGLPDLFGYVALTKIQKFQKSLREKILSRQLRTNKDVYEYTLEQGHIPPHATEALKELKKEGLIIFERSPLVNYEQVYKNNNIISYMK